MTGKFNLVLICIIIIRESLPQFENQIMARVYVRSIMRSTMYQKAPFCSPEMEQQKLFLKHVKIDNSHYPKNFISRINKVYLFP